MVCESLKKRKTTRKKGFRLCNAFARDDGFETEPASNVDNSRVTVEKYFNCFRRPRSLELKDFHLLFTTERNNAGVYSNVTEEKHSPLLDSRGMKKVKLLKGSESSEEANGLGPQSARIIPTIKLDKIPDCVILEIWGFIDRDDMRCVFELSWKKRWFRLDFENALSDERILQGSAVIWGNVGDKYESQAWFS